MKLYAKQVIHMYWVIFALHEITSFYTVMDAFMVVFSY